MKKLVSFLLLEAKESQDVFTSNGRAKTLSSKTSLCIRKSIFECWIDLTLISSKHTMNRYWSLILWLVDKSNRVCRIKSKHIIYKVIRYKTVWNSPQHWTPFKSNPSCVRGNSVVCLIWIRILNVYCMTFLVTKNVRVMPG